MIRHLSLAEVLELHRSVIELWGGATGIRDLGALESALAQPRQSFAGQDLYPDITSKATALCFSLVLNHPFIEETKGSDMPRWKRSSSSTDMNSTRLPTNKNELCWI